MKKPSPTLLFGTLSLFGASLWLFTACGASKHEDTPVANKTHPGWIPFASHCALCHGDHGRGRSASNLVNNQWQYGSSREEIHRNISEGIRVAAMPDFGRVLPEEQIDLIIDALLGEEWEGRPQGGAQNQ